MPYNLFEFLIRSVCETVFKYEDAFLLIKPHPRQKLDPLLSILSDYPADRWMITKFQALQVSFLSNFVISMWSSIILDALATRKPVVEFFDHKYNPRALKDKNGNLCSEYGYTKISVPARNKEELKNLVDGYFKNTNTIVWQNQIKNAHNLLKLDNMSSKRASDVISSFF